MTNSYSIEIKTGSKQHAGTDSKVYIQLIGENKTSDIIELRDCSFEINATDTYDFLCEDVGNNIYLRIYHNNSGNNPKWYIDWIKLTNITSNIFYLLDVSRWFDTESGDKKIDLTFRLPKPIMRYNPYSLSYPHQYLGQLHCHSTRSDGDGSTKKILEYYRNHGFSFVSITDHDASSHKPILPPWKYKMIPASGIFEDPSVEGILYIPGEESGHHKKHFLSIGLTSGKWRPIGGRPNSGSMPDSINLRIYADWLYNNGGLAFAAHPNASGGHFYSENELLTQNFTGMELNGVPCINGIYERWDKILSTGRQYWGILTDDYHGNGDTGSPINGILVLSENRPIEKNDILLNIEKGNFFSIEGCRPSSAYYPRLTQVILQSSEENVHIAFSLSKNCDPVKVRFYGKDGHLPLMSDDTIYYPDDNCVYGINCPYISTEKYVRFEFLLQNSGSRMISQPIFV